MTAPSVDIVIDNRDYAEYLPAAIGSALAQDHPDVRVIVVDDGSTDRSRDVIAGFGDRVVPVLKENGGQASAVNAGIARGSGEIVIVLDADDLLEPAAARRVADAFAADPALTRVSYRLRVVDAAARPSGALKPPPGTAMPTGRIVERLLAAPLDMPWSPMSGNAYRRRALEPVLPVPEQAYRRAADWYLVHVVPLAGPVAFLEDVLGAYRVHGRNGHEVAPGTLDLAHVRRVIEAGGATAADVHRQALALGLPSPGVPDSVSDLAHRIASLRLDPAQHPRPDDRRLDLARRGARASLARRDVGTPARGALAAWFGVMLVAPRPVARAAARLLLVPDARPRILDLVARWRSSS